MVRGLLIAVLASASWGTQAADIVRCVGLNGAVTYQQAPCPESTSETLVGIPTEYPAPNFAERDRLLAREAELYKRLEARREREAKEAGLREARLAREAELERARVAAAADPQLVLVFPNRPYRPHRPRVWRVLAPR